MIRLNGQTITDGLQDWIKEGIKSSSNQMYDLGKFLFGVSAATTGFLTTIKQTIADSPTSTLYIISLLLLISTSIIAIYMILPQEWALKSNVDLLSEYNLKVRGHKKRIWLWFLLWVIALALGLYSLFF